MKGRLKSVYSRAFGHTLVIVGMHRSGTSLVAGIVRRLGIYLGDELLGANWGNPTGHHEAKDLLDLSDRILEAAGGSWCRPPSREAILEQGEQFEREIVQLVEQRNSMHAVWGWKDPRNALTLELFLPHLRRPRLIVVRRDADAVARSLSSRDGSDIQTNIALYEEYNQRIDSTLSETRIPRLEVRYESLRAAPMTEVRRLARFLGRIQSLDKLHTCAELVLDDRELQAARAKFVDKCG